jgi:mannose-6-phosphate isomerase-like protein (cupin superfamily)
MTDETITDAFDLATTHVHLGLGATATPLPDFEWSAAYLARYEERFAADGDDGRLVMLGPVTTSWDSWERHPAGEELVVLVAGRIDLIQRIDGGERRIPVAAGQAVVNPPGVWHTADVHEPGQALFVTPGRGTEHAPRQ